MAGTQSPNSDLLKGLLRDVSRSFYLTLRILPEAVRQQISLAYLLARATDTLADTALIPVGDRLTALDALRQRILDPAVPTPDFSRFAQAQGETQSSAAERILLQRVHEALEILDGFEASDQRRIRTVLTTITSGQELDLQRFAGASASRLASLPNLEALDDYTYRVAGCVGEFWTHMCQAHLYEGKEVDEAFLIEHGIRFGKGLQWVNILRDLPKDLLQGRCYIPEDLLAAHGLHPQDLLDLKTWPKLRPLYYELLETAEAHLSAGWEYTCALPRRPARVPLACGLPLLIGIRTIGRLRGANPLDATWRVKASRTEVRKMFRQLVLRYPFRSSWERLFEEWRPG